MSHGSNSDPSLLKSMSLQVAVSGMQGPSAKMDRKASMSMGSKKLESLLKPMLSQWHHQLSHPRLAGPAAPGHAPGMDCPQLAVSLPRSVPLRHQAEVLVAGGGPGGIGAAVAAARGGADTLLVEHYGFLGGMATAGMVGTVCGRAASHLSTACSDQNSV